MSNEHKPLLESLKDTVVFFKERKTVGRMKTEHAVFIPTALMREQADDTKAFIKAAKEINRTESFNCPVEAESRTTGKFTGIEFVFTFQPHTDFDGIIQELESRLG
jgi:hypothetical protein